jgi:thiol-disulfide isomerase/thioredoxin
MPQRLIALGGLIVIVGGVIGVLLLAGQLGNQGGGKGIENVLLLEPPRAASQADIKIGPQVGRLAPDFEISAFDGTRHRLSDFRGKPVYVNFWATWCVPCTVELPDIQVLEQRHADDLSVITVNRRESLDTARAYSQSIALRDGGTGVSFTVNGLDPDDTLYREYQGLGMPVSFFIDANGVITRLYNGIISLEVMEEAVVEALASGEAGG